LGTIAERRVVKLNVSHTNHSNRQGHCRKGTFTEPQS